MRPLLLSLLSCAALVAGCGSGESEAPAAQADSAMQAEAAAQPGPAAEAEAGATQPEPAAQTKAAARRRGPLVKLRDSQLGPVLFDGRERALYLFTRDPKHKTRCYGACAEAWPPFYARGRPRAASGVDAKLLGTIRRRDGRRQVTYKGQALYFYVHDPKGQVLCNDVAEFGGTWFALDAEGAPPA